MMFSSVKKKKKKLISTCIRLGEWILRGEKGQDLRKL